MGEWEDVSLPIIRDIWEREQKSASLVGVTAVAQAIGVDPDRAQSAILRLIEDGWIGVQKWEPGGFSGNAMLLDPRVGAKGMRALEEWPSDDPVRELLAVVQAAVSAEKDPAQKSKWISLAERLTDIGSGALGGVLGEFLKRSAGLV